MIKHGSHSTVAKKNLKEEYEIGKLLGEGGFGYVHKAVNKKTGQEVAVKFQSKKV
jgi:serine/threonine protein kinase